jgi:hypothetical protein
LLLAVLAVTGIAACGDAEPARQARGARLTVYERRLPDAVRYIEGSIGVVRVERADGSLVAQRRRLTLPANGNEPLFDQPVPEGLYRVVSFQATCAPACSAQTDPKDFDPFRSQECQRAVRLAPGATATLTVELGADPRRCRLRRGVPSGP